jgi:hypothetical protein
MKAYITLTVDLWSAEPMLVQATISYILKFLVSAAVCATACTVIWQYHVADNLYNCTDPGWLDFLVGPTGWVQGSVVGQPGDYGDTIRDGWTFGSIKMLWYSMIGACVVVTLITSCRPWRRLLELRLGRSSVAELAS